MSRDPTPTRLPLRFVGLPRLMGALVCGLLVAAAELALAQTSPVVLAPVVPATPAQASSEPMSTEPIGISIAPAADGRFVSEADLEAGKDLMRLVRFQQEPTGGSSSRRRRRSRTRAPSMIGDFTSSGSLEDIAPTTNFLPATVIGGAPVGRTKIGDNGNPAVADRAFLDLAFINDAPLLPGGVDVRRFTFGLERAFLNGDVSFQLNIPGADTIDSTFFQDLDPISSRDVDIGNIGLGLKAVLSRTQMMTISLGMQVTLPTAESTLLALTTGEQALFIENESVHLLPFVGVLFRPDDDWYLSGFIQIDVVANGNPVLGDTDLTGTLRPIGKINDPTTMFLDLAIGRFVYESPDPGSWIRQVALQVEGHYFRTLQANDVALQDEASVGLPGEGIDTLNLVFGATFMMPGQSALKLGYAVPTIGDNQVQFDNEFRAIFNYHFGP